MNSWRWRGVQVRSRRDSWGNPSSGGAITSLMPTASWCLGGSVPTANGTSSDFTPSHRSTMSAAISPPPARTPGAWPEYADEVMATLERRLLPLRSALACPDARR